jgi:hypothetical protein
MNSARLLPCLGIGDPADFLLATEDSEAKVPQVAVVLTVPGIATAPVSGGVRGLDEGVERLGYLARWRLGMPKRHPRCRAAGGLRRVGGRQRRSSGAGREP